MLIKGTTTVVGLLLSLAVVNTQAATISAEHEFVASADPETSGNTLVFYFTNTDTSPLADVLIFNETPIVASMLPQASPAMAAELVAGQTISISWTLPIGMNSSQIPAETFTFTSLVNDASGSRVETTINSIERVVQ